MSSNQRAKEKQRLKRKRKALAVHKGAPSMSSSLEEAGVKV